VKESPNHTGIFIEVRTNYLKRIFEPISRESSTGEIENALPILQIKKVTRGKTTVIQEKQCHPFVYYMMSLLVLLQVSFFFFFF